MAIGFELDAIQACGLTALGGGRIVLDDAFDIPIFDRLRKRPMRRLPHWRSRQNRQPIRLVPTCAAAKMRDLDHHLAVMLVAGVGKFREPRNDRIVVNVQIAERGRTVA